MLQSELRKGSQPCSKILKVHKKFQIKNIMKRLKNQILCLSRLLGISQKRSDSKKPRLKNNTERPAIARIGQLSIK
jgi:hypothetical protein